MCFVSVYRLYTVSGYLYKIPKNLGVSIDVATGFGYIYIVNKVQDTISNYRHLRRGWTAGYSVVM